MKTKIMTIGVVRRGATVLLRKKPDGSPPYKETWYLFGGEVDAQQPQPEQALKAVLRHQTGVEVDVVQRLGWDTEIKPDHDGQMTLFIYLDCLCEYTSGELVPSEGIEKLEWVPIDRLQDYDLVPPSRRLFQRLNL